MNLLQKQTIGIDEDYKSFTDRCEIHFPHEQVIGISVAYTLAKDRHRKQVRKSEIGADNLPLRYWEHPRRVALIGLDEIGLADWEIVILSLFHDTVEDTKFKAEEITYVFGSEMGRKTLLMSKQPKKGFRQRLIDYADWKVLFVKGCDRIDNNRTLPSDDLAFRIKQVAETRDMYYPLMDLLLERTPAEYKEQSLKLRKLLWDVTEAVPLS